MSPSKYEVDIEHPLLSTAFAEDSEKKIQFIALPPFLFILGLILYKAHYPLWSGVAFILLFLVNNVMMMYFRKKGEIPRTVEVFRSTLNISACGFVIVMAGPQSPGWLLSLLPAISMMLILRDFKWTAVMGVFLLVVMGLSMQVAGYEPYTMASILAMDAILLLFSAISTYFFQRNIILLNETTRQLRSEMDRRAQIQIHLEDEIEARTQAEAEARHANEAKSDFLAKMSHELRTPLNAIIGYSEMIEEELEDTEQDELVPDIQRVSQSGRYLLELINDILDLSKVEAGKLELHVSSFSLPEFIEELRATSSPLFQKNNNSFQVELTAETQQLYSDQTRLKQILLNLLSNASKFTHDGEITLRIYEVKEDGKTLLTFEVRDTGIGMTKAQQDKIFQPFEQADKSTASKYGGTGLGLAITKKFCELMEGQIQVASRPKQGTTFTVQMPTRLQFSPA